MFEVYKPSGGFGLSTIIYFLIGLVVTALLGGGYAFGLRIIPFIYISFIMTGVFSLALGFVGATIVNMGHCRSVLLAALIGTLLCGFGVIAKHYVQYELWVGEVTDAEIAFEISEGTLPRDQPEDVRNKIRKEVRNWVRDKVSFLSHFQKRADEGIVIGRGNGAPIKGIFMYLLWAVELGIVLFMGWMAPVTAAKKPYSEKLGMWADESEEAMRLPISSDEMVERIRSATTVEELLEIPIPKDIDNQRYALYEVHSVAGEELEDAYLSVSLFVRSFDQDGEQKLDETKLVQNAILTSAQRVQLLENASLMQEALDAYRESLAADAQAEYEAEVGDGEV